MSTRSRHHASDPLPFSQTWCVCNALGVVLQLMRVLDQHCALGVGRGCVDALCVGCYLRVLDVFDCALCVAAQHHALDNVRVVEARAWDLHHPHIVNIEVVWVFGAYIDARLRHKWCQEVLHAVDL
eukprot:325880-Chlamydomonas_euryale.AAC.9